MARRLQGRDLEAVPHAQAKPLRPRAQTLLLEVARAFDLTREQLLRREHQPAFQAAVYLLRRAANLSLKETAELTGVSPSRISRIQSDMERSKPDGIVARVLAMYEVKH